MYCPLKNLLMIFKLDVRLGYESFLPMSLSGIPILISPHVQNLRCSQSYSERNSYLKKQIILNCAVVDCMCNNSIPQVTQYEKK